MVNTGDPGEKNQETPVLRDVRICIYISVDDLTQ